MTKSMGIRSTRPPQITHFAHDKDGEWFNIEQYHAVAKAPGIARRAGIGDTGRGIIRMIKFSNGWLWDPIAGYRQEGK